MCALCGLGVVISASADLAPRKGESFVIVDRQLKLCGLSRGAERVLGVDEPDAVHRHVSDFLEPADAEAGKGDELLQGIIAERRPSASRRRTTSSCAPPASTACATPPAWAAVGRRKVR